MTQRPTLDTLYHDLVTGDSTLWSEIENPIAEAVSEIRALICTSNSGAIDLDLDLGLQTNDLVTPILEGPRAFFMSRHTSVQAELAAGKSNVLLDYSLSCDSNFAEKLRAFINGENIQAVERQRVISVLQLRAANPRVQFDVIPFLFENVRFARADSKNLRPLDTLIAFRMLDRLNWEAFRSDPTHLDFSVSSDSLQASLKPEADEFLTSLYQSEQVLAYEAKALGIQALLLRFAQLWHAPNRDLKRLLSELIEFSISRLGAIPKTELALIWTGIRQKNIARFFGPITGKSNDMLQRIRAMAWDMTHLRLLEQLASQSQYGSFYIPYFVSFDAKWRELLRLNPIRFILFDDHRRSKLSGNAHERDFQIALNECRGETTAETTSPDRVEARRAAARQLDRAAMERLVAEEEQVWR